MVLLTWLTIIITRNIGAALYGEYVIFMLVIQISTLISVFGLDGFLLRHLPRQRANNQYKIDIISIAKSCLFTTFFALVIASAYALIDHQGHIMASISWPMFLLAMVASCLIKIFVEVLRSLEKPILYAGLGSGLMPLTLLTIVLWTLQKNHELQIIHIHSMALICIAIIVFLFLLKEVWNAERSSSSMPIFEILKTSAPFMLISALAFLNNWVDKICLIWLTDHSQIGIYAVSNRLAQFVSFPLMAFNVALAPKVAKWYKEKNITQIKQTIEPLVRVASLLAVLAMVIYLPFGKWILSIFGAEFTAGYWVMILLSVAQCINVFIGPVGVVMKMTEGVHKLQYIVFISVIINVISNIILIPIIGVEGAALSTLGSIILVNVLAYCWIKKHLGISTAVI